MSFTLLRSRRPWAAAAMGLALAGAGVGCEGDSADLASVTNGGDTGASVGGGSTSTTNLEACRGTDPDRKCIALKYVAYANSAGKAVVTRDQAEKNISTTNSIWKSCNIQFFIEKFETIRPADYGLPYNATSSESVRRALEDNQTMLVVSTGTWGAGLAGTADAWTETPPGGPFGVVLNTTVATYGQIVAHELGHYLALGHAGSSSNVMSATIYSTSTGVTSAQCSTALNAIDSYWRPMLR